jgi:predicted CXXCH cytochrome family protein
MYSRLFVLLGGLLLQDAALSAEKDSQEMVGRSVCATCHQEQDRLWTGSHHDLAMQPANEDTVLGNFNDVEVTQFGVMSTFYRKDGQYRVRTEGPDGKLQDYGIKYTFGVEPLQQYLIEFPGGRLQALSFAWDDRPEGEGGQRWFHLYPDEKIAHDDELHWTRPSQNWNSMCAECHSTHLQKNYDPANRTFSTTWSEIDVSCEACHGPGSEHVAWAERKPGWKGLEDSKGLVVALDERDGVDWKIDLETGNASRSQARDSAREIEVCARCHSRRSPISSDYAHGEPFMDHYLPRLLDEGMYFSDGQIDGEVYVYGSFLQSRMYRKGVTCSDCHDPHSLQLRAPGNGVCLQCHAAVKYDSASHHFHEPGSPGASCAECHMPPKTYMVVDPRHDHSMRVPRPDLSVKLGTPNACTNCHAERPAEWAAKQVEAWYGGDPEGYQRYAGVLEAGRRGEPAAGKALAELVRDSDVPDIARATALAGIGPYLSPQTVDVVAQGLGADDPMLRSATLEALESVPMNIRAQLAFPSLNDPVRAVRIEAARILAGMPVADLSAGQRSQLEKGFEEYLQTQQAMAERPEAQVNMGNLYAARGMTAQAASAYRTATELDPAFAPAYVNQADLLRNQGEEAEAEAVLRQAIKIIPDNGDVYHALGLSLVRQKRSKEALEALEQAVRLSPNNARYVYVYAVALSSAGDTAKAILVLQGAHNRFPNNTDILNALAAFHRDSGNSETARSYVEKLKRLLP